MADVWYLSRGDTGPVLTGTLEYKEGDVWVAQDLPLGTTVTLSLWRSTGSLYKSGAAVEIVSTAGEVKYVWTTQDSQQGMLTGRFCVTFPSGTKISYPNTGRFQIKVSP